MSNQPTNQPTNQPPAGSQVSGEDTLTVMLRKALGAQRAGIVRYLRAFSEMQARELADAIEGGLDLQLPREPAAPPAPRRAERARTLEPVRGSDPRD